MERLLATLVFLWPFMSNAALINVTAPVAWSCGTGTGGFENGCEGGSERGLLNFTYATDIEDASSNTGIGSYIGALRSVVMVVDQDTRPALVFALDHSQPNELQVRPDVDALWSILFFSARELTGAFGGISQWHFVLRAYACCSLEDDDSMLLVGDWERMRGHVANAYGPSDIYVSEVDWASHGFAAFAISEPTTLALIAVALICLRTRSYRRSPSA